MRLKWYYFLKMSFHFIREVSWLKIRKFLNLEKLENMMKTQSILKKKRFHLLKRHLYQNRKAKNMHVAAGRLVYKYNEMQFYVEVCEFFIVSAKNGIKSLSISVYPIVFISVSVSTYY